MSAKYLFHLMCLAWLATPLFAQPIQPPSSSITTWQSNRHNAAYIEFFGGPSFYSLNYQRITASPSKLAFTYRLGGSYWPGYSTLAGYTGYTTLTGYVGGVWGRPRRALEALIGVGYYGVQRADPTTVNFPEEEKNHNLYLTPQLGYRSQHPTNGLVFRAMLTPYFYWLTGQGLGTLHYTPGLGISIGKAF